MSPAFSRQKENDHQKGKACLVNVVGFRLARAKNVIRKTEQNEIETPSHSMTHLNQ